MHVAGISPQESWEWTWGEGCEAVNAYMIRENDRAHKQAVALYNAAACLAHFVGGKMLTFEEAVERIGHAPGGVCPFALPEDVKTYLDVSLRRFETVFPAVGSAASAIELTCDELEKCCGANFVEWVDVCKGWQEEVDG